MLRLWFSTCKVKLHNPENIVLDGNENQPLIASFWHYSIGYLFYHVRKYQATVMVSASRDGDYITRFAKEFGFDSVRGSRNTKGLEALKGMLRAVRNGSNAAIVSDGSQGPVRIAQPGAVFLASRTGAPIIPIVWSSSRYFVIRSWDRTVIPKPFAQIDIFYGEPIYVPAKLKPVDMEKYRIRLEKNLNEMYVSAWGLYNKTEH